MALLTKEVEVGMSSNNIIRYRELGYEIPTHKDINGRITVKRGTKIKVKVEDLPSFSSVKVKIQCDNCGKIHDTRFSHYSRYNRDGKIYCYDCSIKLFTSGENNYKWRDDISLEERMIKRNYPEYITFVKEVFERDKYICQCCGKNGNGDLVAHHLDGYNWCKEKRTDNKNGITLCEKCHDNFHLNYGYGDNTKEQFEEWINKKINYSDYNFDLQKPKRIICLETKEIFENSKDLCKKWKYKSHTEVNNKLNNRKTNSILGKHIMYLKDFEKMSNEEIEKYIEENPIVNRKRKVECITNNMIFDSIAEASRYFGIYYKRADISHCCQGKCKFVKGLNDEKLEWRYVA